MHVTIDAENATFWGSMVLILIIMLLTALVKLKEFAAAVSVTR